MLKKLDTCVSVTDPKPEPAEEMQSCFWQSTAWPYYRLYFPMTQGRFDLNVEQARGKTSFFWQLLHTLSYSIHQLLEALAIFAWKCNNEVTVRMDGASTHAK